MFGPRRASPSRGSRTADIPGHPLPTWPQVLAREYDPWRRDRLEIDTASATVEESVALIRAQREQCRIAYFLTRASASKAAADAAE
jgi:hypothetical protein